MFRYVHRARPSFSLSSRPSLVFVSSVRPPTLPLVSIAEPVSCQSYGAAWADAVANNPTDVRIQLGFVQHMHALALSKLSAIPNKSVRPQCLMTESPWKACALHNVHLGSASRKQANETKDTLQGCLKSRARAKVQASLCRYYMCQGGCCRLKSTGALHKQTSNHAPA